MPDMPIHPNVPRCQHIKLNGQRCGSPAVKGIKHCFFHYGIIRKPRELKLPPIEDDSTLLVATGRILDAMASKKIERGDGTSMLYGIQVAHSLMKGVRLENEQKPIALTKEELLKAEEQYLEKFVKEIFRADESEKEASLSAEPADIGHVTGT